MKLLALVSASIIGTASFAASLDNNVLNFIHETNVMEVQMGQIALAKTQRADIKAFAQMLQTDHQGADKELLDIAKQEKMEVKAYVPDSPEEKAEVDKGHALMEKLRTLSGAAFDKAFLDGMFDGHVHAIEQLTGWRGDIEVAALASFIDATLPTLESHRDTADELRQGKH